MEYQTQVSDRMGAMDKTKPWGSSTIDYGKNFGSSSESERALLRSDAVSHTIYSADQGVVYDKLFNAWSEKLLTISDNWGTSSLGSVISISERYMLALKGSADHRIFVSSVVNVFRFGNNIDQHRAITIISKISPFTNRSISKADTLAFVRSLREIGEPK